MRFADQTVFVTGAGSGIGRATALRCAAEGANVVVTDVDADGGRETVARIEAADGPRTAAFHKLDVTDATGRGVHRRRRGYGVRPWRDGK